jgi:hypothetical protein
MKKISITWQVTLREELVPAQELERAKKQFINLMVLAKVMTDAKELRDYHAWFSMKVDRDDEETLLELIRNSEIYDYLELARFLGIERRHSRL